MSVHKRYGPGQSCVVVDDELHPSVAQHADVITATAEKLHQPLGHMQALQ